MIFDYDTLRLAWKDESKGKREAPNQQRYRYNLEENLYSLSQRLQAGTFEPAPLRIKQIYYPKRRRAQVPSQEDKIVQHAIADTYAYFPLVAPLIKEASANTRGRGTDYGVELLEKDLRRFWLKYRRAPYILKGDVHNFFGSIPHDRAIALVEHHLEDQDVQEIMRRFIGLTARGLPLGLQQSQLLANLYLSEFDHKLKERKGVEFYGRHMDDFYILCRTREEAELLLAWVREYIEGVGLELNPKTCICYRGFDYLGFRFIVSDTGKIIVRVAKPKLKSKRRHMAKLARQLAAGEVTPEKVEAAYFGWRHHALKAKNARTQVLNMDTYLDGKLRAAGYQLRIYKVDHGKVKWRVLVAPIKGGMKGPVQSQISPKAP